MRDNTSGIAVDVIPQPQKMECKEGTFLLKYDHTICLDSSCAGDSFFHAQLLQREVEESAGMELSIVRGRSERAGILLEIREQERQEGYTLTVDGTGIRITGEGERGLLYGIQTLRQIVRLRGACIPFMEISDWPLMANRGFYHDATRGRVPRMEWLKKLADTMSFYKLNQLQLYIEHTYLFEGLSEVWRDDTPLTAEEIMELDDYCSRLGIELVPSLSCFGHLYKLLRTRTYRHLCEMPQDPGEPFRFHDRMAHHTINVTLDESAALVERLIDEFMPLFRSRHFNICADETFDLGKGASAKAAEEMGLEKLYIGFVNRISRYVLSKGRIPMFWGDIICGFPEFIRELPKEIICLNWGYAWNQSEDSTKTLAEAGAVQYVCPGVAGWNQFMNLLEDSYQNITRMCAYGETYGAVGMLNTDWGDFGHINHPAFSIPGMIYGAEFSWNHEKISFEEINRRISGLEYRDASGEFLEKVAALCTKSVFGWWKAVMYQEAVETRGEDGGTYLLTQEEMEKARISNRQIEEIRGGLSMCIGSMDTSSRKDVSAYLIAADGMRIFNEIGLILSGEKTDQETMKQTAHELELWYYYYKKLWRSVSKESELYQITHVICWYADLLRARAGL